MSESGEQKIRYCFSSGSWRKRLALLSLCMVVIVAVFLAKMALDQWKHVTFVNSVCDEADAIANKKREARESITNSLGMDFVLIPAGEFMMGNSLDDVEEISYFSNHYATKLTVKGLNIERPSHRVRIIRPFYMGVNVVTRGQFRRFVEDTGYKTDAENEPLGTIGVDIDKERLYGRHEDRFWDNVGFEQDDRHPVINVSWNDAVAFCKWLSRREGKKYRLPTEAEWEHACRAGTTTRYWFGNNAELLAKFANTAGPELQAKFPEEFTRVRVIRISDGYIFTAPVGSFPSNPFGLYGMHGNVRQWCSDLYGPYDKNPTDDPAGAKSGGVHMLRGSNWMNLPCDCRCSFRRWMSPGAANDVTGFRVVCEKGEIKVSGEK